MARFAKFALSLGNTVVATATLIVICLSVVAGFFGSQQLAEQQYQDEQADHQKKMAVQSHALISSKVRNIENQIASIAKSDQIISLLKGNDQSEIDNQQETLTSFFPDAKKACLLSADVDDVDPNACVPISFATLNSLRQAKINGVASIGLMKRGTENAHILAAHRVSDRNGSILGVLLLTLDANVVNRFLDGSDGYQGYVELQQGSKKIVVLASQGDESKKKGGAAFSQKIPNTYWRVAYWPSQSSASSSSSMIGLMVILGIIIVMWLVREGVRGFLFKRDVATLRALLEDIKLGLLKPSYFVSFSILNPVVEDIQALGRDNYRATSKKGATAASISQKIQKSEKIEAVELVAEDTEENVNITPTLFKANDIRGIVGQELDENVIRLIGHAIGSEASEQEHSKFVVGRDGRLSSADLSHALIEGILASGCDVIDIGEVPTPVMYYACEHLGTNSGVIVTGSHNPSQYNGLKTIIAGHVISGESLQAIYQRIQQNRLIKGNGVLSEADIKNEYIERIVGDLKLSRSMKIVIDCGNGVAGSVAPLLFKALGCEVIELYTDVDGRFPNHHPNPSIPENMHDLIEAVQKNGAELGIAFDGDGDRLGVVDGYGAPIWPDRLMILFSQDILSRIAGSRIVYDVKCTSLLGEEITKLGGEGLMVRSGYSFIKQEMQTHEALLAGEMSGHIFFKERWYGFDDGLYAAARLLELIANDAAQRRATEVFTAIPNREATPEILVEMNEGESHNFIRQLAGEGRFDGAEIITIDGLRAEYPNGWGLVRASNTTPSLTLRFEADSLDELHDIQQRFKHQMLQIKPTLTLLF